MPKQRWILISIAFAGIFFGILSGAFFLLLHDLPQINTLKQYKPSSVTTVFSSDKKIIARLFNEKRYPVTIDKIPRHLITALITIEDRYFFSHTGVNLKAILRAAIQDIKAGKFKQGASTLTQQLAKTLFLTSEKSFVRKIKEAILTLQIERRYTKNEILELYFNQIYLGSGAYGVEAACQTYFGKSVSDINLAQAALIAGLPKAPSIYSPLSHPDRARKRRHIVLRQLLLTQKITQEEFDTADTMEIASPPRKGHQDQTAYFTDMVKRFLKQQIGLQTVYSKGLTIHTTLNAKLQKICEDSVSEHMSNLQARRAAQGLDSKTLQCALVALDNKSGGILGMVGGIDYNLSSFNRAAHARRQPGSAFKPFVYAAAIQQGEDQNHLILDAPLSYPLKDGDIWQVNNFSKTYVGETTYRKALALSKNTPAVRLMERTGPSPVIKFANKAGISSLLYPNLSLALGTSEVTLLELTAAYIPFANMGTRVETFAVDKIIDTDGRIIYKAVVKKQSVMSRRDAAVMTDMLKAVVLEGTAKKAGAIQKEVAGKTGTTDNYRDALFIGFSPDMALGVWVGNDDSSSLGKYETGARAALPIWVDVMKHRISDSPWQYFDIPDGTKMVYMDPNTGKLSNKKTGKTVKALVKLEDAK